MFLAWLLTFSSPGAVHCIANFIVHNFIVHLIV
jgi:hypothetical protein